MRSAAPSVRTTSEVLPRLIRQPRRLENRWHWARDAQLGEEAQRYANRTAAPLFVLQRSNVM